MATKMDEQQQKKLKTVISVSISLDCLNKLKFLCDLYQKSRSKMVEACVNTIYESCVEELEKKTKKKVKEKPEKLKEEVEG
jgi:hypothetical protein